MWLLLSPFSGLTSNRQLQTYGCTHNTHSHYTDQHSHKSSAFTGSHSSTSSTHVKHKQCRRSQLCRSGCGFTNITHTQAHRDLPIAGSDHLVCPRHPQTPVAQVAAPPADLWLIVPSLVGGTMALTVRSKVCCQLHAYTAHTNTGEHTRTES